jgi:hypothetical protein
MNTSVIHNMVYNQFLGLDLFFLSPERSAIALHCRQFFLATVVFFSASSTSNHAIWTAFTSNLVVLVVVSGQLVLESGHCHRLFFPIWESSVATVLRYTHPSQVFVEIYSIREVWLPVSCTIAATPFHRDLQQGRLIIFGGQCRNCHSALQCVLCLHFDPS